MIKQNYSTKDVNSVGYIYRPWRRNPRTGETLWAKDYGLKAWRIPVTGKKTN